jgi:hypothetical protein
LVGVERILKLTYGLSALDRGEPFPSAKELRELGHHLATLDSIVRPALAARSQTLGKDSVAKLLTEVDADPYWPGLLEALDSWAAASGRYRDLTILTGETAHRSFADATFPTCNQPTLRHDSSPRGRWLAAS